MSIYGVRRSIDRGLEKVASGIAEYWDLNRVLPVQPGSDEYGALTLQEKVELHTSEGDYHSRRSKRVLILGTLTAYVAAKSAMDHNEFYLALDSGLTVFQLGRTAIELHEARTEYNTANAFRTAAEITNIPVLTQVLVPEQF